MAQLSRRAPRSDRLLNGDTTGFAWYCGNQQSHKTSSSRSSYASSSIRSCQFRQACTLCTNTYFQFPQFELFSLGGIHCNCATLGARPTVLPADLVELCFAQRHPGPSVDQISLFRDQRHRAPLPTCGDRPIQHHSMGVVTVVSCLMSEAQ